MLASVQHTTEASRSGAGALTLEQGSLPSRAHGMPNAATQTCSWSLQVPSDLTWFLFSTGMSCLRDMLEHNKLLFKENVVHVCVFTWKCHERKVAGLYLNTCFGICLVLVLFYDPVKPTSLAECLV